MNEPSSLVFIVDDDAQVRDSLANLCRSVGLPVETFSSTRGFLRRDRPGVPACLILDIRFPGSAPSGLDFQRELAETNNLLPIIFITGHGDVPMTVQAMKRGAVEFLLKPVREQALLDAIRHAIERDRRRRHEEELFESIRCRFESLTEREREIFACPGAAEQADCGGPGPERRHGEGSSWQRYAKDAGRFHCGPGEDERQARSPFRFGYGADHTKV
jgi:FixJ family two-component response regulator